MQIIFLFLALILCGFLIYDGLGFVEPISGSSEFFEGGGRKKHKPRKHEKIVCGKGDVSSTSSDNSDDS
jgi:hypothetical protein